MILLLLPLFLSGASAGPTGADLIEQFECGPQGFELAKWAANQFVDRCVAAVQDGTNLCCKAHDLCFDTHSITGYTRDLCDARFCNCLQDVSDRTKNFECSNVLDAFCLWARHMGDFAYQKAVPDIHAGLGVFQDTKPFGFDLKSLVDTCQHSKLVAVHCHNAAHKCLQGEHIYRHKRMEMIVNKPEQDCHSAMHHCLQMIVDFETNDQCVAVAKSLSKKLNIYYPLDEKTHGKAIIDAYPISISRLLKSCTKSTDLINACSRNFDQCASQHRQEQEERYSAARKIKIECHQELSECVRGATRTEDSVPCVEARNVAIGLIREKELKSEHAWHEELVTYFKTWKDTVDHHINKGLKVVVNGAKKAFNWFKSLW